MLPGGYSSVLKAKDRDEFRDEIVRFAQRLGFDTVAAVTVVFGQLLPEALAEAEKASRAKSDFMGVMSHELRTPMNAILSCAMLLSQSDLDTVQKRTLGVLEEAGRQMLAGQRQFVTAGTGDHDTARPRSGGVGWSRRPPSSESVARRSFGSK